MRKIHGVALSHAPDAGNADSKWTIHRDDILKKISPQRREGAKVTQRNTK
jgi:hypothetical protein